MIYYFHNQEAVPYLVKRFGNICEDITAASFGGENLVLQS